MNSSKYTCNICKNVYFSKNNYKKHAEVHIPCNICGYICLTNVEKKHHPEKHSTQENYGYQQLQHNTTKNTLNDVDVVATTPSTSAAAARKRQIAMDLTSCSPSKRHQEEIYEGTSILCVDCNIQVQPQKWFTHSAKTEHKQNVLKSVGNKITVIKSTFSSRMITYRFPKGDHNLNINQYLEEGCKLFKKLLNNSLTDHIIIKFNMELTARYKLPAHPLKPETDMYHITEMMRLSRADDVDIVLESQFENIKSKMSEFQERDSGWTLIQVKWLDININKVSALSGSEYIPTPKNLAYKRACINIINKDAFCFKWSVIAAFHNGNGPKPNLPSKYAVNNISDDIINISGGRRLNFTSMSFPTDIKDIHLFEKNNIDISINVFGYDNKLKTVIGPYYITKNEKQFHINLLLLESECGEKFHYILINDISR